MKRCNGFLRWASLSLFAACLPLAVASQEGYWNIKKYLTDPVPTLKAAVRVVDTATGEVEIYGSDSAQPTIPFTFDWADGQSEEGWFNRRHTYQDRTRNYFPKVTAHYADGSTGEVEMVVLFVAPQLDPQPLPSTVSVTIPDHPVTLTSRVPWGSPPGNLTFFDDSFFPVIPRAAVEYVLTAGATVEEDLINGDHILIDGGFDQVVLLQPGYGGGQAFTWASPLAIASNEYNMQTSPDWSLLFHELRHNFQANSPADPCFLYFGVDGRGGLFLWEGVARILQVTPAYELLNDIERYGLGREIPVCIEETTLVMVTGFRDEYFGYVASGMPFTTYFNDPAVPPDGVVIMACVMATRFWVHAEEQGLGYRVPSKRFMKLVHTFDQEAYDRWDSSRDTPEAELYRSTFMVTALSYAFNEDLRDEFRALNFPVSDTDYEALWQKADTDPADFSLSVAPVSLAVPRGRTVTCTVGTEALEGLTHEVSFRARLATPGRRRQPVALGQDR